MFFPKTIAWTLAAATSLASSPAHAAPDPQPNPETQAVSMEEVVVTAGFRDTELMTSAGSISVLDREAMVERAARHLQDTLATMPNVNFSVGGARARFVQMRGVGDLEQFVDPKHFPSVGIVLDGIELSNVASSALLFDAEQIEVLRGPQGTQFGASALAGMINIRSRDPGEEFEADFDAGYGNFESWHVSAAAGGPLSETLRARVAIRQNNSDGFMKNAFLGRDDTQNLDELTARAKFIWDITPDLSADVTTLYVDADNGYDAFTLNNTRTTLSDTPGSDAQEAVAVSAQLRWDMGAPGAVQLQSTFSDADERYGFDEDWVFAGFCDGRRCDPAFEFNSSDAIEREREQVTVDLRWLAKHGKLSWVTGAYFHHRQEDMARERFGSFTSNYETDRYALYGQLELALTERVTARLGIRGEAFNDDYDDSNAVDTQTNATFWSGDATLEFQARVDTLLYATLSRGAKPGGVNTSATSVQPIVAARFQPFVVDRLRFDTETLFNKELGLKGRYLDDRLDLRLSVFHMDRSNAQLESWLWDASTFTFVGFLDNVDDAENYGVELEMDLAVTDAISLLSRVGYLETNVDSMQVFDLDTNTFRTLRNRDQAKAPRWQYHFGMRWQVLPALAANLSIEGRDESFFGYYHDEKLEDYALMNTSLAYQYKQATVRLWARNLLNTQYAVHGLYFANDQRDGFSVNRRHDQFGEGRVYGAELSWVY